MFYQDNNDYMRDFNFNGNGISYNYPYSSNTMMYGNMQNPYTQNNFQMPMQNQGMFLENMYPQIYKIITPVVNRVIANSNYQYMTEDVLNNMVDTIYNIVEGDVSNLVRTQTSSAQGDDTVASNINSNTPSSAMNNRTTQNSSNSSLNSGRGNNNTMDNQSNSNELLKDLIKIIIIKELLSRRNTNNGFIGQQGMQMGNYNYMPYGI